MERIRPLLERGASVDIRDDKGKTALHRAAQAGLVAISALLIDAAFHGRVETLRALVEAGADLEARNQRGETPLFAAVRGAAAEAVEALKAIGASVEARNGKGLSPADVAARSRKKGIEAVRPLLAA